MMTTMPQCGYDSGSMTDCQPLCDAPARYAIDFYCVGQMITAYRCERHYKSTLGSLAQPSAVLRKLETH